MIGSTSSCSYNCNGNCICNSTCSNDDIDVKRSELSQLEVVSSRSTPVLQVCEPTTTIVRRKKRMSRLVSSSSSLSFMLTSCHITMAMVIAVLSISNIHVQIDAFQVSTDTLIQQRQRFGSNRISVQTLLRTTSSNHNLLELSKDGIESDESKLTKSTTSTTTATATATSERRSATKVTPTLHPRSMVSSTSSSSRSTSRSTTSPSTSVSSPLPPVLQDIANERMEFRIKLGRAMDTLRRDMSDILTKTPDFTIYDDNIEAIDPSGIQAKGIANYKSAINFFQTFIQFWFNTKYSSVSYRMVYDFARSSIKITWNIELQPKFHVVPTRQRRPVYVEGISYYLVDPATSGTITEHKIEKLLINQSPVIPPFGILNILQQQNGLTSILGGTGGNNEQTPIPVGGGASGGVFGLFGLSCTSLSSDK